MHIYYNLYLLKLCLNLQPQKEAIVVSNFESIVCTLDVMMCSEDVD